MFKWAALPFLFGAWSSKNDIFCICIFVAAIFCSVLEIFSRTPRHEIKVKYFTFFLFLSLSPFGLVLFFSFIELLHFQLRCVLFFFRLQIPFTHYLTALQIRFRFCIKRVSLLIILLHSGFQIFYIKRWKMELYKFHYISLFSGWKWQERKKESSTLWQLLLEKYTYTNQTLNVLYTANKSRAMHLNKI